MKEEVLETQNLPEQLCLLADSPRVQGHPFLADLFAEAYVTDLLQGKIPEAIGTNHGLREINIHRQNVLQSLEASRSV